MKSIGEQHQICRSLCEQANRDLEQAKTLSQVLAALKLATRAYKMARRISKRASLVYEIKKIELLEQFDGTRQ